MTTISRHKIYFWGGVILLAGMLLGAGATWYFAKRVPPTFVPRDGRSTPRESRNSAPSAPRTPEQIATEFAAQMRRRYELPEEKVPAIAEAFVEFFQSMNALQTETEPRRREYQTALETRLQQILPPDKFTDWQTAQQNRQRGRRGRAVVNDQ